MPGWIFSGRFLRCSGVVRGSARTRAWEGDGASGPLQIGLIGQLGSECPWNAGLGTVAFHTEGSAETLQIGLIGQLGSEWTLHLRIRFFKGVFRTASEDPAERERERGELRELRTAL